MMRRFASAAIAAVALFAPVLTGVLMDNSVVSVLGAPDENCGSGGPGCAVGGAQPDQPGNPPGGYFRIGTTESSSGTTVTAGGAGRFTLGTSSQSGNIRDPAN